MKKLKHVWIFSDSIKGHEIQSCAIAKEIAEKVSLFHCSIRQPWLSFAPRILPRFGRNIIWENAQPDLNNRPDAIITCGRRMAAVGKYFKKQISTKHIQILNPKDNVKKYDVVICPKHDNLKGKNVIQTTGSLHDINQTKLSHIRLKNELSLDNDKKIISLLIGNPGVIFFNNLSKLAQKISQKFPQHDLYVCGSRRTHKKYHAKIKNEFSTATCWLSQVDGDNPYLSLLASSDIILVTADSINMVSEACATDHNVIAIGQDAISPKHQEFINSIDSRLSIFDNLKSENIPLNPIKEVMNQLTNVLKGVIS